MSDDLFPDAQVPIEAQIDCVKRELKMRERVYTRQSSLGNMSPELIVREMKAMGAVLETLEGVRDAGLRHRDREADTTEG